MPVTAGGTSWKLKACFLRTPFLRRNKLIAAVKTAGKENDMNRGYQNNGFRQSYRMPLSQAAPAMSGASCPMPKPEHGMALAIAYVPSQKFENLYPAADALRNGTLFADLNLPYCAGGGR